MSSFLFRRSATASTSAARAAFSTTSPRAVARLSIVGNLGDTPELRTSANGNEYVRYSVASNTGPRDNRHTSWFSVAAFVEGGRRDFLLSLAKGSQVFVEGDARMNQYQDADGKSSTSLSVTQRSIEILRSPQSAQQSGQ